MCFTKFCCRPSTPVYLALMSRPHSPRCRIYKPTPLECLQWHYVRTKFYAIGELTQNSKWVHRHMHIHTHTHTHTDYGDHKSLHFILFRKISQAINENSQLSCKHFYRCKISIICHFRSADYSPGKPYFCQIRLQLSFTVTNKKH